MNFLKEIFRGNSEQDYIHQKFVKYGRGEFEGPAITVKKTGNSINVKGSYDYSNILGWIIAKNSSQNLIRGQSPRSSETKGLGLKISGSIISKNLTEVSLEGYGIKPVKSKKKSGIFTFDIKGVFSSGSIKNLYEDLKDSAILFDISSEKGNLKTKKKIPNPGAKMDRQFCSASLNSSALNEIANEIIFDDGVGEFKEIKMSHRYLINELLIPEEYKNDPATARVKAKRKGIIKRILEIDGKITGKEHDLMV